MNKQDWIRKLTSRKFWLALAGLITGIIQYVKQPTTDAQTISALILALGSVVAYCAAEGLVDANREDEPTVLYVPVDEIHEEDEPPEPIDG